MGEILKIEQFIKNLEKTKDLKFTCQSIVLDLESASSANFETPAFANLNIIDNYLFYIKKIKRSRVFINKYFFSKIRE